MALDDGIFFTKSEVFSLFVSTLLYSKFVFSKRIVTSYFVGSHKRARVSSSAGRKAEKGSVLSNFTKMQIAKDHKHKFISFYWHP